MTVYIPRHFSADDPATLKAFIRANAFGTLITHHEGEATVSHIPFVVDEDAAGALVLHGHVARANPHWKTLEASRPLVIFSGPHGYISPTWYEKHPSVPTWNYAVVHAHGSARLVDMAALERTLGRLSAHYESANPQPWRMDGLERDYIDTMTRAIVGFEIAVERLEGKFKLSQNRIPADQRRVIAALQARGEGDLAAMMLRACFPGEAETP
jgi:transcriptional regulator